MSIRLIADVVNQLGSPALYSNSLANRPPAGFGGRLFISSDTHEIYQDVITGWNLIADAGAGAGTLDSVTHNGNTTTWGINILSGDLTLQATQKLYVLGLANGAFSIAAIASMMRLAVIGGSGKEGVRIGLWGGAQAIAFGLGGLLGASASDLARSIFTNPAFAYSSVFFIEAILFIASAYMASQVESKNSSPSGAR